MIKVGKMTLNRNPDNFFAETEQVAFHTGHVVPGIDFTNDPLLQGRLFSYIDTQLRRVGPNFHEIPINRSLKPPDNNQRDGFARMTINKGKVSYFPNSLGGGCPMHQPAAAAAFRSMAVKEALAPGARAQPELLRSLQPSDAVLEQHERLGEGPYRRCLLFELNQVVDEGVRNRTMNEILVNIHPDLAEMVSGATGIAVSPAGTPEAPTPSAPTPSGPLRKDAARLKSPALSMDKAPPPPSLIGRKVAVLLGDGVDAKEVQLALAAFAEAGLAAETIGPHGGTVATSAKPMKVNRAAPNAPSVVYDAVFVPAGVGAALAAQPLAQRFVHEAFRHGKPIAVAPDGEALLEAAGVPPGAEGIAIGQGARLFNDLKSRTSAGIGSRDASRFWPSRREGAHALPASRRSHPPTWTVSPRYRHE